jgi:hypothetical protein
MQLKNAWFAESAESDTGSSVSTSRKGISCGDIAAEPRVHVFGLDDL